MKTIKISFSIIAFLIFSHITMAQTKKSNSDKKGHISTKSKRTSATAKTPGNGKGNTNTVSNISHSKMGNMSKSSGAGNIEKHHGIHNEHNTKKKKKKKH